MYKKISKFSERPGEPPWTPHRGLAPDAHNNRLFSPHTPHHTI